MNKITTLLKAFALFTLYGTLGHAVFYVCHHSIIARGGDTAFFPMLCNALRLDMAVAGYVCIVPALLLLTAIWWSGKALLYVCKAYLALASFLIVLATLANIVLYGFWGFPLDSTPLFYLLTSPADAVASVTTVWLLAGLTTLAVCSALVYYVTCKALRPDRILCAGNGKGNTHHASIATIRKRVIHSVIIALLTALLFIPIRGGFTVATNNVGSVFFSNNRTLNHCAVNPVFSCLYSLLHDEDLGSKYRFMQDREASALFGKMTCTTLRQTLPDANGGSTPSLSPHFLHMMKTGNDKGSKGVNVVMVIMESFSSYIMTETGHVKGVTPTLDSLAAHGMYFTNFYANSFRTDRGLVAILSGYPAQPTTSIMKYPHKTNSLYGIARSLHKGADFDTYYIYGGDANFTNMRAYLHSTGFDNIVAEEHFDASIPRNKWGVDDRSLFTRAISEMTQGSRQGNRFFVVQTSSSHEPYDVPVSKLKDKALNAFYFSDQCLGQFIAELRRNDLWDNTLLVVVPDHLGCYPADMDNFQLYRYQIPLIMSGGAITRAERIATIGSQQDIAATLLALLGIDHGEYLFSKDLLDSHAPHFAFFAVPDAVGMVTEDNQLIYDNEQQKTVLDSGSHKGRNLRMVQAYLQKLYDNMDSLGR